MGLLLMFKYNDYVQVSEGFFEGCKGYCEDSVTAVKAYSPDKVTWILVELDTDKTGNTIDIRKRFKESELKYV